MESEEELEIFPVTKHRPFCSRCERPAKTCLCPWISDKKLFTNTEIIVIQNPHEAKSSIGTVFLMKLWVMQTQAFPFNAVI